MSAQPLSEDAIREALGRLDGWELADDTITRTFQFGSFKEAFGFLARVAFEAEARNHHPEIWNVYNRVRLSLNTHDAGGKVTEKDIDLAEAIQCVDWTRDRR